MGQEPERLRGAAAALQAHIRGYLVRKRFRSLQEEYESTVMEIEGGLDRLQWKGSLLPRPVFLQEVGPAEHEVNAYCMWCLTMC